MALKFGKRIKIAPGIRVNLSKSGVSTTVGPRGASVNIGKKGVHANTGIPGTGLSMRTKIAGSDDSNISDLTTDSGRKKTGSGVAIILGALVLVGFLIWLF